MAQPRGPRSIRLRLTLLVFAITLAAIAVIYFYVTPSLESSLRAQRVSSLETSAHAALPQIARTVGTAVDAAGVDAAVRDVADRTASHVTLLGISTTPSGPVAYQISDSAPAGAPQPNRLPLAMEAAQRGRAVSASLAGAGGSGVVALPIRYRGQVARVAVFSQSLEEVQQNVSLIRRKILGAGAIALVLALIAGTLVARALSMRVRRLEATARRVAAGDFTARFPIDSRDELGQLASALDDMQRQLEELDSARKRFIATASHELRTPIFSLGGFLELIQDEDLDEETRRQFVGQLQEQVDRLGKLTAALLDLSKLEAGSMELAPESTDLGVLARSVTGAFAPALTQHGSHLELRVVHEPIMTMCDPERVAQIMRVLVDNAITHTPAGTDIVVTVSRAGAGVGGGPVFAVLDSGPGIPPALIERIFEPFYTSDGVAGSGLGLAIARELAERMGASLTVASNPEHTVFTLAL